MHRRRFLTTAALGPLAGPLLADLSQGDKRLARLYGMFMAPCCWRENLLVHQSPKADELRAEIRSYLSQGWTDEQIKAAFIKTYERRILSHPEGSRGLLLSYMPVAATILGAGVVALAIRQSIRQRPAPATGDPTKLPDLELE